MIFREGINRLRQDIFARIADDAKKGLTEEVTRLATLAESCDVALQTASRLENEIDRIREELKNVGKPYKVSVAQQTLPSSPNRSEKHSRKTGSRGRGREVRDAWIAKAMQNHGVRVRRLGEVTYETASGKRVGIPYASEAAHRTYPWWLGLPDEKPDYAVLLCETDSGEIADFIFPSDFVSRIWNSLSRDKNHHVKFHISRRGANWELKLKDGPSLVINQYRGKADILR